jgi:hypothetical protein
MRAHPLAALPVPRSIALGRAKPCAATIGQGPLLNIATPWRRAGRIAHASMPDMASSAPRARALLSRIPERILKPLGCLKRCAEGEA